MQIIFYEKPGCSGNAKQKQLLDHNKITYETRDILRYPWSFDELSSFFIGYDKEQIYNPFAPQIKHKELVPKGLSKEQLIKAMLQDPILIKRPLLVVGTHKLCGFDIKQINSLLQTDISESISLSTCQSQTCP